MKRLQERKVLINFKKVNRDTQSIITRWLDKPHVKERWDEQTDHPEGGLTRRDLLKFVNHQPSIFTHWIAYDHETPYAYIMTSDASTEPDNLYHPYLEPNGKVLTVDFFIGEENFLNKGLSYVTLREFGHFISKEAKALLVDPDDDNEKAIHAYRKAGFRIVGEILPAHGPFEGKRALIMKWKL